MNVPEILWKEQQEILKKSLHKIYTKSLKIRCGEVYF